MVDHPPGFHLGYAAGQESVLPDDETLAKAMCAAHGSPWRAGQWDSSNNHWRYKAGQLRRILAERWFSLHVEDGNYMTQVRWDSSGE